jgi:hypothetical protein
MEKIKVILVRGRNVITVERKKERGNAIKVKDNCSIYLG